MTADSHEYEYPGKSIGLPRSGSGSIASLSRRVGALATDWIAVVLLSAAFFDYEWWSSLVIFFAIQAVFILTMSGSPGHRIWGMRVMRLGGGWAGPWRPFLRALLTALVIPVAVWDENHRGLHDVLAGTVLVRR